MAVDRRPRGLLLQQHPPPPPTALFPWNGVWSWQFGGGDQWPIVREQKDILYVNICHVHMLESIHS